jgi:hypothetical protein
MSQSVRGRKREHSSFPLNVPFVCRAERIRTSDLLNPIHEAAPKKGLFSELFRNRRFLSITIFTRIVPLEQGFYCPYCPATKSQSLLRINQGSAAPPAVPMT